MTAIINASIRPRLPGRGFVSGLDFSHAANVAGFDLWCESVAKTSRRSFDSGLCSGGGRIAFGIIRLVGVRGVSLRPGSVLLTDYCERLGRRSCAERCMISPMLKPLQS